MKKKELKTKHLHIALSDDQHANLNEDVLKSDMDKTHYVTLKLKINGKRKR